MSNMFGGNPAGALKGMLLAGQNPMAAIQGVGVDRAYGQDRAAQQNVSVESLADVLSQIGNLQQRPNWPANIQSVWTDSTDDPNVQIGGCDWGGSEADNERSITITTADGVDFNDSVTWVTEQAELADAAPAEPEAPRKNRQPRKYQRQKAFQRKLLL